MKTKDYIQKLKDLEHQVHVEENTIYVYDDARGYKKCNGEYLLYIKIDAYEVKFRPFFASTPNRIEMLRITMLYLETNLANRGVLEEPKFYLRRNIPLLNGPDEYFKKSLSDGRGFTVETKDLYSPDLYQNLFTQAELDAMDITGFKPVPEEDVKK